MSKYDEALQVICDPLHTCCWNTHIETTDTSNRIADVCDREHAQRIVDCYHACSGMADPVAEIARLRAEVLLLRERLMDVIEAWESAEVRGEGDGIASVNRAVMKARECLP